jgi:hypothetical protein
MFKVDDNKLSETTDEDEVSDDDKEETKSGTFSGGVKLPAITSKSSQNTQNEEPLKSTKRKKKVKGKKLVLNVSMCKYHVVRYVGRSLFKMRLSNSQHDGDPKDPKDEWDLFWTDG